jgi:hypothetical protein
MSVASRPVSTGKTRTCPHCKATILESLSICPGCMHHLRFDSEAAKRQVAAAPALRVEGIIRHPPLDQPQEYFVIIAIRNDRGEEITRQVVGVGALQPAEKRTFSLSVEVLPPQAPPATKTPVTAGKLPAAPAVSTGATTSSTGSFVLPGATAPPAASPASAAPQPSTNRPGSPGLSAGGSTASGTGPSPGAPTTSGSTTSASGLAAPGSVTAAGGPAPSGGTTGTATLGKPASGGATPVSGPTPSGSSPIPPGAPAQTPSSKATYPGGLKPPTPGAPRPPMPGGFKKH